MPAFRSYEKVDIWTKIADRLNCIRTENSHFDEITEPITPKMAEKKYRYLKRSFLNRLKKNDAETWIHNEKFSEIFWGQNLKGNFQMSEQVELISSLCKKVDMLSRKITSLENKIDNNFVPLQETVPMNQTETFQQVSQLNENFDTLQETVPMDQTEPFQQDSQLNFLDGLLNS